MSIPPLSDIPDLQGRLLSSIGALLIGGFFSICLFGANSLQAWYYYQHYPADTVFMKSTVACVWIFEAAHAIFICHAVYFYAVLGFGTMSALASTTWSLDATVVVTGLLTLTTHWFFAWRVYILSRKRVIPSLIALLGTGHAATTWAVAGMTFGFDDYADVPHSWENITTSSLALGVATDLMIACSLGYHLHHARSGIPNTDKLINKLIFWAVNIGILTSIADFTVVALIFVCPLSLNNRRYTQDHVLDEHRTAIHLDSLPSSCVKIKKSVTVVSDVNFHREAQGESRGTIPSVSLSNEDIGISSENKSSLRNGLSDEDVSHC